MHITYIFNTILQMASFECSLYVYFVNAIYVKSRLSKFPFQAKGKFDPTIHQSIGATQKNSADPMLSSIRYLCMATSEFDRYGRLTEHLIIKKVIIFKFTDSFFAPFNKLYIVFGLWDQSDYLFDYYEVSDVQNGINDFLNYSMGLCS